ncbi:MAG: non-ribosomal peptide synthetase, partial [Alteromonadaceae bacterium]
MAIVQVGDRKMPINVADKLSSLANNEVYLLLVAGSIKLSDKNQSLTSDDRLVLKENKSEIVEFFETMGLKSSAQLGHLSFQQKRLWLINSIESGSSNYNNVGVYKLVGNLDRNILEQTFRCIIERHSILRTCYFEEDGIPYQYVKDLGGQNVVEFVDLSDKNNTGSIDDAADECNQYTRERAAHSFDLTHDLPIKIDLLALGKNEHLLIIVMHHIASDGWSSEIIVKELNSLYNTLLVDESTTLEVLPVQYLDYAQWQHVGTGQVENDKNSDANDGGLLSYWLERLKGAPHLHQLQLDYTRPTHQSYASGRHDVGVSPALTEKIKRYALAQGASPFMVLYSAFSILLARYSGQQDIVIGTPVANRERPELAGLIGFFANTLVLRSDLSSDLSFKEFLTANTPALLNDFDHQAMPFEQLVDAVNPERSLSYNPLIQISFALKNYDGVQLVLNGLNECEPVELDTGVQFDLTLNLMEGKKGLSLNWEYSSDIFKASTIEQMATHFDLLLNSLLLSPDENVFKIEMLSEQDRHQLLVQWNDTTVDYPQDLCIHQLFEAQAESKPNAVAVVFENQTLTYGELNEKANQLAHYLINEKQVKPDALVGICIERSLEMVIAIQAILKAGGAYVPLDPEYPKARLEYMLEDANLNTVLTQTHLLKSTPISDTLAVCLDSEALQQQLQQQATHNPSAEQMGLNSNNLAYVIYTSGSTGNPKGVMVEHQALVNRVDWMNREYGATPEDRILQKTPFSFDVSVWEFMWPLSVGAGIVLAKPQGHKDPTYLSELIQSQAVTKLHFVPSMLTNMLSLGDLSQCSSLRQVFCSGEELALHSVNIFQATCPWVELHNLYGPTEAAIDVSYWNCSQINADLGSVPIGRPINNIQLHVLNSQLMPVPPNVAGELHIGGVGLARGYLNRTDLTDEKFISNPFYDKTNPASSERLYKTGDLARWIPEPQGRPGNLEFLGRIDHQVKIRGFRIELGEIENTLIAYSDVSDAVVVAKVLRASSDKQLVAYVATDAVDLHASAEQAVTTEQDFIERLRQRLNQSLPDYMVPSVFVLLDALPLTPNGKVDRKALPEADVSAQQNVYVAPTTDTEKVLCELWQEVLGVEQVGVTDNFFHLGGHSLLVMQVISRLQQQGLSMSARQLFSQPRLIDLAEAMDNAEASSTPVFTAPANLIPEGCEKITPEMLPLASLSDDDITCIVERIPGGVGNVQDIYPLAPLQEGILFHHMMSAQNDPYVMPALFAIDGLQAVTDFIAALQFSVDRHDVLRTVVLWEDLPTPVQVVCRQASLPVTWLTLDENQDVETQMRARFASDLQRMDLGQAPLFQLQIAADPHSARHFVLLQYHHIIFDHVGLEIIQKEMAIYQAGKAESLPAPVPYREFVAHVQHQAEQHDAQAFFTQMLSEVEEPTAPFNVLDVTGDGSRTVELKAAVPSALATQIRAVAKRSMISPAVLFHAAWAMLVSACSGRDDVVFGTVLSGRLQGTVGAEHMLGVFINTLPLRVTLRDVNARDLVDQVQSSLRELLPYEQASLALAQRCSSVSGDAPLFTAMLNYRHSAVEDTTEVSAEPMFELITGQERTNYPFILSVDDLGEGFALEVQVDRDINAELVVGYMQTAVAKLLEALASSSPLAVSQLSVLPEADRHQLLAQWNDTAVDYPQDKCIHHLFEAQVENNPNAVALVFENQQLTYGELNEKANQLAHYLLKEKHIKPDALVGICIERSLEMVIAIQAVLKAGGAYVPLDPEYPRARLEYMLEDANLSTVLTQAHLLKSTPISDDLALCLDDEVLQQQLQQYSAHNPSAAQMGLNSNNLAYVIYTSGSTGNPKGVMVEHQALVNRVDWMHREYGATSEDRILQKTPFSFDVSVWEFMWPLAVGAGIVLAKPQGHKDPEYLSELIQSQAITKLHFVPSMLTSMLSLGDLSQCSSLRQVFCSGEELALHTVNMFQAVCPWAELHNLYGPTEAAIDVSYWNCNQINADLGSVPIGRPINNIQLHVLNSQLMPVPPNVVGELHIGGVGLARGYLNRSDLTDEKFIANPFYDKTNPASSERLYKTGDLARWLPEPEGRPGNLEFLGRIDHQVKIRGFRIELGEIENTLITYSDVNDVVVVAKELAASGDKSLVAYVATNTIALQGEARYELIENLRNHMSQALPDHMVPSAFVLLEKLPLTPNGKVDRKALPEPDASGQQKTYVAPSTDTEKVLCELWQDVLGLEQVGISDNFFHLGGHSLLVMQVISRLQKQGLSMAARQLFSLPRLSDLAEALDNSEASLVPVFTAPANLIPEGCEKITPEMLPLVSLGEDDITRIVAQIPGGVGNVQDMYPLAPLQEGILFHHMMSVQSDPYVMPALFAINGLQAVTDFIAALQFIIDRHDVLRSVILWDDLPTPLQVVCRQASLPVTWLTFDEDQDIETQMRARFAPEWQRMDLGQAPLLQLQIAAEPNSDRHFLLFQYHHIIFDHVGLEIIQKELEIFEAGQAERLPAPVPYREFVAHVQHQAEQHDVQGFFTKMLSDVEEPTAPFNVLDVTGDGSRTVELKADIPSELATQLRAVAKSAMISPAVLFHAAWAMLVSACSGRDDVVFGTVLSGRLQGTVGAEHMLGVFINTLPLRVKLRDVNARALIDQVQTSLRELLPYEQASLALAQSCSSVPGDAPLFTAMLNYRHSAVEDATVGQASDEANAKPNFELISGQERTNYPFILSVDDLGEGFGLEVQVDCDISAERVVAYMQTAVATLVEALASASPHSVNTLSVLPKTERQQLLAQWNDTTVDYPQDKCIHQLFEAQVENNPNAVALIFENQQLTYGELNEKANQLAHYLIDNKQVKSDTLVGICIERSLEMVIAIQAILKAGGAYVPLDPEYPEARLKYMLEDANLSTVLTQTHLLKSMPLSDDLVLCLDDEALQQQLQQQATHNPSSEQIDLGSNQLAYVIYTSGSTGKPKGVMVEHQALVNRVDWMHREYGATSEDRILQKTPFSFDVSVWEFMWPLAVGAGIVLAKPQGHKDPEYLSELIQSQKITKLHFVPSMLTSMLSLGDLSQCSSLRQVFCSGEELALHTVNMFQAVCPWAELHNLYGPTEAAIDVSYWNCNQINADLGSVPIGRPINNIQLHVLNSQLMPVPLNVVGELHIGGVGLARGYLNRADLSDEKFIANPFYDKTNPASSERLYKTGDLARWLPEPEGRPGNLEFLGRIDHQVKIRGFRIELGEIENTLITYADVNDVVVVAKELAASGGDKSLVAYVVTSAIALQGEARYELIENLRKHMGQALPDHMVPSAFVLLDKLPLTPNGKVDRKALPEPDASGQQATYVAPSTETEKVLCQVWQDVLGLEQVGITDNFFHLGGHSLLVMQVISRLQQQELSMTARQLFSLPILSDLAEALDNSEASLVPVFTAPANLIPEGCEKITPEMLPLVSLAEEDIARIVERIPGGAGNVQDIYPLAPLQEGILFHHMMSVQGDPYVLPSLFAIDGSQALTDFIAGLQFIMDRHDVLRTAIFWDDLPAPVQVVCRQASLRVIWLTLNEDQGINTDQDINADKDIEAQMRARCAPEWQRMDLGQAPLLQLQIAADPDSQRHFVLLQYHHIISDHVGLEIIQKEMEIYEAGHADRLPAPVPYREFIAHVQHQALEHDAEVFFTKMLSEVEEPTAPFNVLDVAGDGSRTVELKAAIPSELATQIRAVAKTAMISPAVLFHAAWAMLVSACSGRDDVVFGTVLSGRLQGTVGAEHMLGVFINTLPLRVTLRDVNASEFIDQVQASLRELLSYEHASLALAQNCSGVSGDAPLFTAMLNYRHSAEEEASDGSAEPNFEFITGQERTNYPFMLSVDDLGEGFDLEVQVDRVINAERVVAYMQTAVAKLVEALASSSPHAVNTLSILPDADRHQLLVEWNDTAVDYPRDKCIHQLFEAQVENNPNAVALVFENQQLTYAELNKKANQLAHYLISEQHVTSDALVGICVERSVEMVIGILAILKAGGAYVPLDPEYPAARLEYMLEDAKLTTVLTQNHLRGVTPVSDAQALYLDDETLQQQLQQQSTENPRAEQLGLTSSDLAYVIYTSGSTGNPKGVMVEQSNVVNFLIAMSHRPGIAEKDCLLALTSISFDIHGLELFLPLIVGAKLVVASKAATRDTILLLDLMVQHDITIMQATPSTWRMLTDTNWRQRSPLKVLCGGEALSLPLASSILKQPLVELWNMYGPTETTIWSCVKQVLPNDIRVLMGTPIGNTQVYVTSETLTPVPVGVAGELLIGGAGVTRGYRNQPGLTDDAFVPNPFYDKHSPASSALLYKTGDLVRWVADTESSPRNLEFLGRIDHQVKIRGFRIELGEIENTLIAYTDVNDAVVVAKELAATSDKQLVAYVVTDAVDVQDKGELAITAQHDVIERLRQHINQSLPDYMVPSVFVLLEALPLTPNGKVDRKALPEPDTTGQQKAYVAPSTKTEKVLCEVWQKVLGVEQVGITDNFFYLGGHSLLVMQVISCLQQQGLSMAARQLFRQPRLADLAEALDNTEASSAPVFTVPANLIPEGCEKITPEMLPLVSLAEEDIARIVERIPGGAGNVQDIYPLAPLQEGILFHHMMSVQGDPYVRPTLFAINGAQAVTDFIAALQFVMDRHDVLRTAIFWDDFATPVQVVCRQASIPVTWLTLDDNQGSNEKQDLEAQMRARCAPDQQRMDLGQAPLFQLQIAADSHSERHLVLLQYHHIISDHVGLEMIQKEWEVFEAGQAEHLPAPVPYREFIAHVQYQAQQHDAEAFFTQMLADIEEPTAPFNVLNVSGDGSRTVELKAAISSELALQIRAVAKSAMISPAVLFHAAWAMLVSACSGRDDVVFGTVLSGRLQGTVGAENMLGVFINTLPLRVTLRDVNARAFIDQVQESLRELLPYEQASLALAQRCSSVPGDAPLFTAMLNYRHSEAEENEASKVQFITGQERSNYPFILSVDDLGEGFELDVQVDCDISAERVVAYMQTAVANLLEALESSSPQTVNTLSVLPDAERYQHLVEWNDTTLDSPRDNTLAAGSEDLIHTRFEAQALALPKHIAVSCEQHDISYEELNTRANKLAHYLVEYGVKPDALVGICVDRSLDMLVGILAILKSGGAYVPIDPTLPEDRVRYILEDSGVNILLSQKSVAQRLEDMQLSDECKIVFIDEPTLFENYRAENVDPSVIRLNTSHLAYVIYTSGSTGRPKGVLIEHRNVGRLFDAADKDFTFSASDTWTLFHSYAFDFSVWEIWGALFYGGRLVVVPKNIAKSSDEFYQMVSKENVTVLSQTPSAFSQFVEMDQQLSLSLSLRYVVFGGEALNLAMLEPWVDRHGDAAPELINMYGITETTVHVTYNKITIDDVSSKTPQSIRGDLGIPLADLSVLLLSPELNLCPVGVIGEMYVRGDGLARGYLNREALSAERFINNPFCDDPFCEEQKAGEKLYRSGDLAVRLVDGSLKYMGRIDHQVKVRGFRIELGEIERNLVDHPKVSETIVIASESKAGVNADKYLVAYVVAEPVGDDGIEADQSAMSELLRLHLKESLPEYMLPSVFVFLDELPLTANGKVDRKALPDPQLSGQNIEQYEAPRTTLEKALCDIWQETLAVEKVGINSSFFVLGGHSLSVLRLVAAINNALNSNITVKDIFEAETIQRLVEIGDFDQQSTQSKMLELGLQKIAEMQQAILDVPSQAAALPADYEDFYPLSSIQQSMVFFAQTAPDTPIYHDQFPQFANWKDFNFERFKHAAEILSQRHAILRTSFDVINFDVPMQIVHQHLPIDIYFEDLSQFDLDQQKQRIETYCSDDLKRKFEFHGGMPFWRVQAFGLGDEKLGVILSFQHAILDGWSAEAMRAEMETIYEALTHRDEIKPDAVNASVSACSALDKPELSKCSYKDYVALEIARGTSPKTVGYWENYLDNYSRMKLPFNYVGRSIDTDNNGTITRRTIINRERLARLQTFANANNLGIKEICLAAHVYLMSLLTGDDEVLTGVVTHDRPELLDSDKVLGCFLNTIPLRMPANKSVVKVDLVNEVKNYLRSVKEHEIFLGSIARIAGETNVSGNPLFDTIFNYTDFTETLVGQQTTTLDLETTKAPVDFTIKSAEMTNTLFDLEIHKVADTGMFLQLKYSPRYFAEKEIDTAISLYLDILDAFSDPSSQDLLDATQFVDKYQKQIDHDSFNATDCEYDYAVGLHELFERQTIQTPNAIAVSQKGESISYSQLNERANKIARLLISEGVKQGDNVGIVLTRSIDLIAGVYGILKAGGAYVPMEPDYPLARKKSIVESGEITLILSDTAEIISDTAKHICLENYSLDPYDGKNVGLVCDAYDLAYIIYTSGSTGKPKGVRIKHHSAVNLLSWVNNTFDVGPDDSMLFVTSICFDLSVYDVFGLLSCGGRIVVAEQHQARNPEQMFAIMQQEQVTFWDSVPTTINHLIGALDRNNPEHQLDSLRLVFMSGDWIPVQLPGNIKQFFPNTEVISLGGATEGTVWSNYYPIDTNKVYGSSIPYGKPIDNNRFYVLDSNRKPTLPGVAGELYIAGVGVADGYQNDKEKTDAAYFSDPFITRDINGKPAHMYKTGDLGRIMACGNMEILGRIDHQVKLRGFRIELGEIESLICQHPDVKEAIVNLIKANSSEQNSQAFLAAYVVQSAQSSEPSQLSGDELKHYLSEYLAEYMVPSVFVLLEELPLTPNGKVDRKALPEPDFSGQQNTYVAPRTETEKVLCEVWQEALGIEQVGITDNFFHLGGHSLLVMQIISRLQQQGLTMTATQLFSLSRLSDLAEALDSTGAQSAPVFKAPSNLIPEGCEKITPEMLPLLSLTEEEITLIVDAIPGGVSNVQDIYPLAPLQEGILFHHVMSVEGDPYVLPSLFAINSAQAVEDFITALQFIQGRHDVLRTAIVWDDLATPVQVVCRQASLPVTWLTLDKDQDIEVQMRARCAPELQRMDLRQAPLLQLQIAADPHSQRHLVLLQYHHIISDHVGLAIIKRELDVYEAGHAESLAAPVP